MAEEGHGSFLFHFHMPQHELRPFGLYLSRESVSRESKGLWWWWWPYMSLRYYPESLLVWWRVRGFAKITLHTYLCFLTCERVGVRHDMEVCRCNGCM